MTDPTERVTRETRPLFPQEVAESVVVVSNGHRWHIQPNEDRHGPDDLWWCETCGITTSPAKPAERCTGKGFYVDTIG